MKTLIKLIPFIAVMVAQGVLAEPVAVIVNSANNQMLSPAEVKSIYGDKTIAWSNGDKIAVYNLPPEDQSTEPFAQKVLGMSARDAAAEESNRAIKNTSRNPQQTKRAVLVSSIVSKTPGAIGYVPKDMANSKPGIRVLFIVE